MAISKLVKQFMVYVLFVLLITVHGCQSSDIVPITSDDEKSAEQISIPVIDLLETDGVFNSTGLMGSYELMIDPFQPSAELISKRNQAIGESYIVNGKSFFTITPCVDCLVIKHISLTYDENVLVTFTAKHPFQPGDPSEPPSNINRLDLNTFDLALLVQPVEEIPEIFELSEASIYPEVLTEPDGYTTDLANVIEETAAIPYILIVDNNEDRNNNWNKFPMGAVEDFDVIFEYKNRTTLIFDLHLTMGYGASADQRTRLNPKYYNPEFNRKSAWKVKVTPPEGDDEPAMGNTWDDFDPSTRHTVTVEVFDWQMGADVYHDPDGFENAYPDNIFSSSEVASVSLEIPGLAEDLMVQTYPEGGTGTPEDPLVYIFQVANETLTDAGVYTGLIKVTDERQPSSLPPGGTGRDYLVDSPDGFEFNFFEIPEYATYQTFSATVVPGGPGIVIQQVDYETLNGTVFDSSYGCVKVGYSGVDYTLYFNMVIDHEWVVQNIPLFNGEGTDVVQSAVVFFDLGVEDGTDLTEIMSGWLITEYVLPYPSFITQPEPVYSRFVNAYVDEQIVEPPVVMIGGEQDDLPDPEGAQIIQRGASDVNQECPEKNYCTPTAVSNSLHYLISQGLPKPKGARKGACKDPTSIECWKHLLGTTKSGGTPGGWEDIKKKYNNALGITTEAFGQHQIQQVKDKLEKEKCDVEMELSGTPGSIGHTVRVTGIKKVKPRDGVNEDPYIITIAHDLYQKTKGGCVVEEIRYDHYKRKITAGNCNLVGRSVKKYIVECKK